MYKYLYIYHLQKILDARSCIFKFDWRSNIEREMATVGNGIRSSDSRRLKYCLYNVGIILILQIKCTVKKRKRKKKGRKREGERKTRYYSFNISYTTQKERKREVGRYYKSSFLPSLE